MPLSRPLSTYYSDFVIDIVYRNRTKRNEGTKARHFGMVYFRVEALL